MSIRGLEGRDLYALTHPPPQKAKQEWQIPQTRPYKPDEKPLTPPPGLREQWSTTTSLTRRPQRGSES